MATADLTIIPVGREGGSTSDVMAEIHRRLEAQSRVEFRMHAMGTALEGSLDDILAVAGDLHSVPFELGLPRVYTVLKIDERRDRETGLDEKEDSVRERLREERGPDYRPGD